MSEQVETILEEDRFKDCIVESLSWFKRVKGSEHLYVRHHVKSLPFDLANAWRNKQENVQRALLKYASQRFKNRI